ncbi:restriction endonuclease [Paracoccus litorisediminis]|uniref:restriction endonuclease n=1 Tax=Paracoccus litorisediminis TaxID=2006130 RepID=UPI00372E9346
MNQISAFGRRLYLFRPSRLVAYENLARDEGLLVPDFGVHADLTDHYDYEEILREVEEANPGEGLRKSEGWAKQLHLLLHGIQAGDLIMVPFRKQGHYGLAMARPERAVAGSGQTGRRIEWLNPALPASAFLPDLEHSFAAQQSVCSIERNDALSRVCAILASGRDPGPDSDGREQSSMNPDNVESFARGRMLAKIGSEFAGHGLAELVSALLSIDGYRCRVSSPGPDGGVDILAGRGMAGLETGLVVQVKSGGIVADAPTFQQLVGAMSAHGTSQGLLVSWSGVTRAVRARMLDGWFKVRIWDGGDILDAVLENYDTLPLAIRDRLGFRPLMIC